MLIFITYANAQVTTNFSTNPGTSSDGSHKLDIVKVELYDNCVLVHVEITALKPIRNLKIYDNDCHILYGRKVYEGLGLAGFLQNDKIHNLGYNSSWGWEKISRGAKVNFVLYFGGGSSRGNSIPAGATEISILGIGVDVEGNRTTWEVNNIKINNPRKNYTHYSSEHSIKQYLDINNDGICGIYEVIGDDAGSKLACVKYNGNYTLIFISDNLGRNYWKMGDIKAILRQSASGLLKADWYMSNKEINKDCYAAFDGKFMTVLFPSESDEKEREKKYLKMYPTSPPSYINNQMESAPQKQLSVPQPKKRIPVLKKQNVKK